MPTYTKLRTYVRNTGVSSLSAAQLGSCGIFSSSTMMVMMMAMTPSLNASSRAFVISGQCLPIAHAKQIENAVEPHRRNGLPRAAAHERLGAERNAETRQTQHREIVGTVPDRDDLLH